MRDYYRQVDARRAQGWVWYGPTYGPWVALPGLRGPWTRAGGVLSVIAVVCALLAIPCALLGIVLLFFGLPFLVLAGLLAALSLVLNLLAAACLVIGRRRGDTSSTRSSWRGIAISITVVLLPVLLVVGITYAPEAKTSKVRTLNPPAVKPVRSLPASATPLQVVNEALRVDAGRSGENPQLCGLLVQRARNSCFFISVSPEKRTVVLLGIRGDVAIVRYGSFIDDPLVVRLRHSTAGWELEQAPDEFPGSDCATRAVKVGTDPFLCP